MTYLSDLDAQMVAWGIGIIPLPDFGDLPIWYIDYGVAHAPVTTHFEKIDAFFIDVTESSSPFMFDYFLHTKDAGDTGNKVLYLDRRPTPSQEHSPTGSRTPIYAFSCRFTASRIMHERFSSCTKKKSYWILLLQAKRTTLIGVDARSGKIVEFGEIDRIRSLASKFTPA